MEVGTVFGLNNLKAIWYGQIRRRLFPVTLRQADNASIPTGTARQLFSPFIRSLGVPAAKRILPGVVMRSLP